MSVRKIREAVQAAEGNARQMGEVVLMIAQADEHAAEVIAADLDNPEMSFDKCFDALYEHAKKHQKNNSWCCENAANRGNRGTRWRSTRRHWNAGSVTPRTITSARRRLRSLWRNSSTICARSRK